MVIIGTASYDAIYFDSFGVEHIPKEIKKFIGNKNVITNIYRIEAYNSIMCGCFCIGFDLLVKSVVSKNKNSCYCNIFLEKGSCEDKSNTHVFK